MSLTDAIRTRLENGPATEQQITDAVDYPRSTVRNTLAAMYFNEGMVGCDTQRRYHLLKGQRQSNGVPVIRHLNGEDVFA